MSKFDAIYRKYITEAGEGEQPTDAEPTIDNQNPGGDGGEPLAEVPIDKPGKNLDSGGYVTMVRLLRDAFIAKPSDEDAAEAGDIGEINANNADAQFKLLLGLIRRYNNDTAVTQNV